VLRCTIWIRLPQVSSNTAVVSGSIWGGLLGDHDSPVAQPLELDVDAGHGKGRDPGPLREAKQSA
jgi:hypothetical protein